MSSSKKSRGRQRKATRIEATKEKVRQQAKEVLTMPLAIFSDGTRCKHRPNVPTELNDLITAAEIGFVLAMKRHGSAVNAINNEVNSALPEILEDDAIRSGCDKCRNRFEFDALKECGRCRLATYCSTDCQLSDWSAHRHHCIFPDFRMKASVSLLPNSRRLCSMNTSVVSMVYYGKTCKDMFCVNFFL